jgi:hypothetical protein
MTLDMAKRYTAALICAVGLSLFGNTVWADSGSGSDGTLLNGGTVERLFNWIEPDGTTVQINEQDARARCEQCKNARQQNNNNDGIMDNCTLNMQVCLAVNVTF